MITQGCHFYTQGLNFTSEISAFDYHSDHVHSKEVCSMMYEILIMKGQLTETQR